MKRFSKCLMIGLVGMLGVAPKTSWADLEVSASVQIRAAADFHAPLSPHGTWVEVGSYGRCWRPTGVVVGWQPYSHGSWVWTDCGWYWASDEPWSWACYHYGSWARDPLYGWVWIPGIEWAPAWVYWRVGGGYCGWAPRGPHGVVVAPRTFVFVETARIHERVTPSTLIVNNTKVVNQTTEVGSIKYETRNFGAAAAQKVAVNEGPGADVIRKATGKPVEIVPITAAAERHPVPADAVKKIKESQTGEGHAAPNQKPQPENSPTQRKGAPQPPSPTDPQMRDKDPNQVNPPNQPLPDNPPAKPGKSPGKPKKSNHGKGNG